MGRVSVDNTPVSGNQEDHVSMSATAAHAARRTLRSARQVVAVELLCGAQAAEFVDSSLAHGVGTGTAYRAGREAVPPLDDDRPLHGDMSAVNALVTTGALEQALDDLVDDGTE